jgi:FkbM family methyltransferase
VSGKIVEVAYRGQGVRFLITEPDDHIQRQILQQRSFYENDLLEALFRYYLPGTGFIDVGANIGNHTLFGARILGAWVTAFEPDAVSFSRLEQNLLLNELTTQVTAHRVAVGDQRGRGRVVCPNLKNRGQCRFVLDKAGDVDMIRLDDLDFTQPVSVIKIDIEGGEPAVIRGATRLLARYRPYVFLEAATPSRFWKAARLLRHLGYIPKERFCVSATYLFCPREPWQRIERCSPLAGRRPRGLWSWLAKIRSSLPRAAAVDDAGGNSAAYPAKVDASEELQRSGRAAPHSLAAWPTLTAR